MECQCPEALKARNAQPIRFRARSWSEGSRPAKPWKISTANLPLLSLTWKIVLRWSMRSRYQERVDPKKSAKRFKFQTETLRAIHRGKPKKHMLHIKSQSQIADLTGDVVFYGGRRTVATCFHLRICTTFGAIQGSQ